MLRRAFAIGLILLSLISASYGDPHRADFSRFADGTQAWEPSRPGRDWMIQAFEYIKEGERDLVRVSKKEAFISIKSDTDPTWKKIKLSCDVRLQEVLAGPDSWRCPKSVWIFSIQRENLY